MFGELLKFPEHELAVVLNYEIIKILRGIDLGPE